MADANAGTTRAHPASVSRTRWLTSASVLATTVALLLTVTAFQLD